MRSSVFALLAAAVVGVVAQETSPAMPPLEKRALATVYTKCKVANTVAITFDDGPYSYEQELITTLAKYKAKATFFLNGHNWACIYDDSRIAAVKALYAAGHELGGHTWSHANMSSLTWDKMHNEMWKVEEALIRIVGVNPALFRPPYGEYNNLALSAIAARNQSAIMWDFDSGDSSGKTPAQTNALYDTLASKKPSSVLTLNHSTYNTTAKQTIPHALEVLSKRGYKFVTVSQCLGGGVKAYQWTQKAGVKDSTWKC
ncbi:glycoside hydrolase/deacetylase [Exidia glandulosa HHB12029]|uniref:Glycoside hydrolase/deacetylase n=1 Tax=Exidia glandulosa HHB12029 TaxID=1314781 RepID=A0A165EVV1_EXIGL|nr:glycoside hydrolase/deacetylase [Exidia glandulosa HHB12029]